VVVPGLGGGCGHSLQSANSIVELSATMTHFAMRAMGMGMGDGGCVARGPNTPQACDEPPSAPQRMAAHALLAISKLN